MIFKYNYMEPTGLLLLLMHESLEKLLLDVERSGFGMSGDSDSLENFLVSAGSLQEDKDFYP